MIASEGTHEFLQFLLVVAVMALAFFVLWFPALRAYSDLQGRLGVKAAYASRWRAWLIGPRIPLGTVITIPVKSLAALVYWILRDKAPGSDAQQN